MPIDRPVPVAVTVKDMPPADLLHCASRPAPIPDDDRGDRSVSMLSAPVRSALIGIARAFAANAAQLDRLINWSRPGTCPAPRQ